MNRLCLCGCGQPVKAAQQRYASRRCFRHARPAAGEGITISSRAQRYAMAHVFLPDGTPPIDSWWVGLDREAFDRAVAQRFPG